jgi:hypothetical protein
MQLEEWANFNKEVGFLQDKSRSRTKRKVRQKDLLQDASHHTDHHSDSDNPSTRYTDDCSDSATNNSPTHYDVIYQPNNSQRINWQLTD